MNREVYSFSDSFSMSIEGEVFLSGEMLQSLQQSSEGGCFAILSSLLADRYKVGVTFPEPFDNIRRRIEDMKRGWRCYSDNPPTVKHWEVSLYPVDSSLPEAITGYRVYKVQ